jgi:hypothetical protein
VKARPGDALVSISAAMPATARRAVNPKELRVSLHLARLLIEAMGGTFSVERAAIGKGARVTLSLPTRAAPAAAATLETAEARRAR